MEEYNTIICNCGAIEHQLNVSVIDDEVFITPYLANNNNFFRRIWIAVKYIFGYKSKYGAFDEIKLDKEKVYKLISIIEKVK